MAVIHEMLFHTHIPNIITLLPALPVELAAGGYVSGVRGRGGIILSMRWENNAIYTTEIQFGNNINTTSNNSKNIHPWLYGLEEIQDKPGFFR